MRRGRGEAGKWRRNHIDLSARSAGMKWRLIAEWSGKLNS